METVRVVSGCGPVVPRVLIDASGIDVLTDDGVHVPPDSVDIRVDAESFPTGINGEAEGLDGTLVGTGPACVEHHGFYTADFHDRSSTRLDG